MSIAESLVAVRTRIAAAAKSAGRDASEVRLVAVSKTHDPRAIREAYAAGQRMFGESYAQELAEKSVALANLADLEWHFIGHLQSNKVKLVAPVARMIHTVHSRDLADEIGKRADAAKRAPLDVLVEVKLSNEPTKHGASPEALGEILDAIARDARLRLRGLMTIPAIGSADESRRTFEALAVLRDRHGGVARLPELSMGMTDDLEIAIACGATLVRVGTAIFGARVSA